VKLKLITPLTAQPVSLDEAKLYLRVLHNDEDFLIESFIKAAVDKAEQITGRALSVRTYELYKNKVENTELPYPPLRAVNAVEVKDGDTYKAVEYVLDDKATPAVIYIDGQDCSDINCFKITFECGYDSVPEAIKQWILVQVATLYEHRSMVETGTIISKMPRTFVDHLLDSYRVRLI